MLAARSGPRMTMVTAAAPAARNSAACPAELPPPATTTGEPAHNRASSSVCATSLLTGSDEGTLHSISVGNVTGSGRYLDVKATSGDVLLYKLTADTAVPEPSSVSFMLLSGILLCGVSLFKAKRA